jgi:hypothetical protein
MMLVYTLVLALVVACAIALVVERRRSRDAEAVARLAIERSGRRLEAHRELLSGLRQAVDELNDRFAAARQKPESSHSSTPTTP